MVHHGADNRTQLYHENPLLNIYIREKLAKSFPMICKKSKTVDMINLHLNVRYKGT